MWRKVWRTLWLHNLALEGMGGGESSLKYIPKALRTFWGRSTFFMWAWTMSKYREVLLLDLSGLLWRWCISMVSFIVAYTVCFISDCRSAFKTCSLVSHFARRAKHKHVFTDGFSPAFYYYSTTDINPTISTYPVAETAPYFLYMRCCIPTNVLLKSGRPRRCCEVLGQFAGLWNISRHVILPRRFSTGAFAVLPRNASSAQNILCRFARRSKYKHTIVNQQRFGSNDRPASFMNIQKLQTTLEKLVLEARLFWGSIFLSV